MPELRTRPIVDPTHNVAFGWIPDLPDHRDKKYILKLPEEQPAALPPQVDLRPQCSAIYDQLRLGSCTANAIAGALEFDRKKQGLPDFVPSRLFIYYNERVIEDDVPTDAGANLRDGIKSVATQGFPHENLWPYDIQKFSEKPPPRAYDDALKYTVMSYFRLDNSNLDELKSCLAAGFPFVFGFAIHNSFFVANTNGGIVPMPGGNDDHLAGGHAVMVAGYSDGEKRFTIRNSWGPTHGDQGYYYMPYDYLTNQDLSSDFWTVRLLSPNKAPPMS